MFEKKKDYWRGRQQQQGNPGHLPAFLSIPKLKKPHGSFPPNPLLAEPLYLAGFIERLGTGIPDMINACLAAGLKEPDLVQEEEFKAILWRRIHVTEHVTEHVKGLVMAINDEMSRLELQKILAIKHRPYFMESYINPALQEGFIEMTLPGKPKSVNQKYRLTKKGETLQKQLKKTNK